MQPEMFTSWGVLAQAVLDVLKNPYLLATTLLAMLCVFVEHTTKGLKDSKRK